MVLGHGPEGNTRQRSALARIAARAIGMEIMGKSTSATSTLWYGRGNCSFVATQCSFLHLPCLAVLHLASRIAIASAIVPRPLRFRPKTFSKPAMPRIHACACCSGVRVEHPGLCHPPDLSPKCQPLIAQLQCTPKCTPSCGWSCSVSAAARTAWLGGQRQNGDNGPSRSGRAPSLPWKPTPTDTPGASQRPIHSTGFFILRPEAHTASYHSRLGKCHRQPCII
jgi:hypothetical protein